MKKRCVYIISGPNGSGKTTFATEFLPNYAKCPNRVSHGGHDVPVKDIKRRFTRSIDNFFNMYRPLLDTWLLFDNSQKEPKLIAKKDNLHIDIRNRVLFKKIIDKAGVKL